MRVDFVRPSMTGRPAGDAMEPSVFAVLAALAPDVYEAAKQRLAAAA